MLLDLEVLIVDVQTTGASPALGRILELAYCQTSARGVSAGDELCVASSVLASPDAEVPPRILKLTGISAAEVAQGRAEAAVFAELRAKAGTCSLAVAHFARFERAFVEDLWVRTSGQMPELSWLCTHALCQRLFPRLPSRSLRAIAGYFGAPLPPEKRARTHVLATAAIWTRLSGELAERGITSREALQVFLAEKPARVPRESRQFALSRAARLALPDLPGIYRMLAKDGRVLYVGKAKSLKSRVNSYFRQRRGHSSQKNEMLAQVYEVATVACETALEAALLETDEIKKLAPPYNVALQAGTRELGFFSRNLERTEARPGAYGPYGRRDIFDGLKALKICLDTADFAGEDSAALAAALAEALIYGEVAMDVFAAGVALLREQIPGLAQAAQLRSLLARGCWLARRAEAERKARGEAEAEGETEDAGEAAAAGEAALGVAAAAGEAALGVAAAAGEAAAATDEGAATDPDLALTPETVARALLGVLIHAGAVHQRSLRLRRLSNATILWKADGGRLWRQLQVSGGALTSRAWLDAPLADSSTEPLVCNAAPFDVAPFDIAPFDVAAYDRVSVLSAELSRMRSSGATLVEIRYSQAVQPDRLASDC